MCNKEHKKHCCKHYHNHKLDKDVENAIVESGAKEHLKECEDKKKSTGKFDWRKYCHKKERILGYNDLKFTHNPFGEKDGKLELPNGFVINVHFDKYGVFQAITIRDGMHEWVNQMEVSEYIPSLSRTRRSLHDKADLMYICDVIRIVQGLTEEDRKKFRNK